MRKIKAVATPDVRVEKFIAGGTDLPALEWFTIKVYDADFDAQNAGAPEGGLICKAELVVLNPSKGNVAQQADDESQELVEVASAFYGSRGHGLSERAEAAGADTMDDLNPAPLLYVQSIETRKEFMPTGQDVAGLAVGMAEIASQYGLADKDGLNMMMALYKDRTLSVGEGPGFANLDKQPMSTQWMAALGAKRLVADGEVYAATEEQLASAAAERRKINGFGGRLEGNELWGAARFEPAFKIQEIERDDADLQEHVDAVVAASADNKVADKLKSKRSARPAAAPAKPARKA